ncbi:putative selenate ABC transporter substrate-binding protein [Mangrovimicrobium sediminis]|uniref:Putative selenate ABC transporter substrate-binding protein n=1 Tax=Mangrovimicrobium sediminis TaxID=2562682 RepID=A0A4Z0LTW2_9GAMM|nr:putative selenate ABC transporter substrate-binding protein [Haliea sp. SAOS-164]
MLSALLLCLFAAPGFAATFTFTAIPDEDESRLVERFGKVADYLEQRLGVEVRYLPVKSYPAAITAFRLNQVQLAWFGGLSGVQARRLVPGAQAIAQGYEDQFFRSYFIANTSTGLTASEQLDPSIGGRTFTFGAKGSTSGRLMPEFFLRQQFGKAPEALFSRVGFSGDHSMTIAQVQAGVYALGVVNYLVWESELAAGKIDTDKVRVIWQTPDYPDYQWTVRGDVDAVFGVGFADKLRAALLEMDDPALLEAFPRKSFVPASNADYQPIEDVARELDLLQ